ncbi:YgjV family protein, partial [Candidatus Saccharibacteria bacterium]|nr:YgjV family protein [Candidatus Saccharibacteria bacterium]
LTQLIGVVGIALLIATFQGKSRSAILKVQIVSCLNWSLYYFLVGAYSGAGMVLLGAVRTYVYERYRKHEWIFEVSIIVYAIMTLLTWKDWTSILPFMGILAGSIAIWQKEPRRIRLLSFTPTAFWSPYNILSGSYMGMVGDLVTFTAVFLGVFRYDMLPRLKQQVALRRADKFAE